MEGEEGASELTLALAGSLAGRVNSLAVRFGACRQPRPALCAGGGATPEALACARQHVTVVSTDADARCQQRSAPAWNGARARVRLVTRPTCSA